MPLKKSPEYAHNSKDKNGRRHDTERKRTSRTVEDFRSNPFRACDQKHRHQPAGKHADGNSAMEHPVGIAPFPLLLFFRDQFGNGKRQTVRRQDQTDVVDLICRIIISDPFVTKDPCHWDFVEKSDQTDDDSGSRQDRTLNEKISAGLSALFTHSYFSSFFHFVLFSLSGKQTRVILLHFP